MKTLPNPSTITYALPEKQDQVWELRRAANLEEDWGDLE
jgi:hypothetical protein